jgi:CRISPR-associated protein Csb2
MPTFRLSIRLLDGAFHGRGDGGEPEWPPSPLRAFQSLVNAATRRWQVSQFESYASPALQWLEGLGSPTVVAPPGRAATRPYRLYVPNNAGDLMVAAWARGNGDANMAEHRTEKDVRPTRFAGPDRRPLESNPDLLPIHYDWSLTPSQYEAGETHLETLKAAARSITHLGWGVDQAVGHAELLAAGPPIDPAAERWLPADVGGDTQLRVPRTGTLADLRERHTAFVGRLGRDGFQPVPPLSAYRVIAYRRATDPAPRPWAAFAILKPDASGSNSFSTPLRCRDVAAWVRNATAAACDGWPFGDIAGFVHGHDAEGNQLAGDGADDRFMYLPLPSIERRGDRGHHVGSIRRVLVAAPPRFADRVDWVRRRLPGRELVWDGEVKGLLNLLPTSDWVLRRYTGESRVWSTVTPVVMPGHDDGDPDKAERLLRKAFEQSGLPAELVRSVELEWRSVGFRPGVELVRRYQLPESPKKLPPYHVRVRFTVPVRGPLAVGAGRYRGLGVFAGE